MSKPPAPSDTADKFMLRLPPGMREQIAELAKANNRSMNAEIIVRLQASILGGESAGVGAKPKSIIEESFSDLLFAAVMTGVGRSMAVADEHGNKKTIADAFVDAISPESVKKVLNEEFSQQRPKKRYYFDAPDFAASDDDEPTQSPASEPKSAKKRKG